MEVGFAPPVSGSWATPENMIHIARRAELLGYHSLWTFQRLLVPADLGWSETYHSVQDPVTTLAFLAAHTTRIRLGVAVLNMPFLSPVLLAKQTATLDILSGGRLDVGLGLGWADEEYQATGASRHRRGQRAAEFIAVLRSLWQDDVTEHRGEFYRVPPTRMEPKPVQRPHPPILLGGQAPQALSRAGRLADGWVSGSQADLKRIGEAVAAVKAAAESAGRDPGSLRFVCRGAVRVRRGGPADREPLTGTLEQIRSDFGRLAEAGITEVFVDLNFDPEIGSPRADAQASLRRADEVLDALAPTSLT
ncbi:probable F420-dependent oxidoreductase, Rv2161c family [Micromonospora rhizosphaerae]|uniref:Probable F420-dependent oxidoreductase, Rv2161c family n=1 Tax=Micromonospora rhizosphaerae TaxID=568872 RepID=A0A1C6SDR7_9ACTN|nr:TIGR03619 family F420-dependent LLM class oxidoreductase [Micromonospora rhizosphaerae]SCL27615.1 probable F420-dependent oxidoreductase, Rv2161c family [Micromonospora rhizosphaerae]